MRRNKALDPTARAGCDQAFGLPPSDVLAGQRRDYARPEVHKIIKIIIETQRLKIVEVTIDDIDLLYQLTGNKDVMRYFPKMLSYDDTRQMTRKILDHYKKYGHCFWKVLLKSKNEFVGITGLLYQEIDGKVETEIAFRIRPEHWNNGYATEAAKACKDYGETVLRKKGFISLIHPQNNASKRVAQKLGAQRSRSVLL